MNSIQLMQLTDIGNSLINTIKNLPSNDDNKYTALLQLIRIEKILDAGRTLASMTAGLENEALKEINAGMDLIRTEISSAVESMDNKRVEDMLDSEGEKMKLRFSPRT